jgi:predicted RNase H-like nuclease (RuvC/YqgF family)
MTTGKRYDFLLKQMKDRESGVESLESTSQEPEVVEEEEKTLESRVETEESRAENPEQASQESRIEKEESSGLESRVETEESEVKSPDRIRPESRVEKVDINSLESRVDKEGSRVESLDRASQESKVEKKEAINLESRVESLDYSALDEAIEEAKKKPKLGVYSPVVAAMLRYKAITIPRYSMGSEIKTIVEQALKGAYPELYEEVKKRMNS